MLFDIGVNLTNSRFDKDRTEVIKQALNSGVQRMLITGTSVSVSQQAINLAQENPTILAATAGVHPHDADSVSEDYIQELFTLAQSPLVKAIGECGLDFNRNFSTPENQQRVFQAQVQLAVELNLPLFLHQRDAFEQWLAILKPYMNKVPAMVTHCFTGNKQQLFDCIDNGMFVGITGWVCDKKRGQTLRDIVKYIPLERLMIETDAPYLTPQNIRPKPKSSRNVPAYLPSVVEMLAQCMPYSTEQIIEHSFNNACRVFSFDQ